MLSSRASALARESIGSVELAQRSQVVPLRDWVAVLPCDCLADFIRILRMTANHFACTLQVQLLS